jgi:hypothetical protein
MAGGSLAERLNAHQNRAARARHSDAIVLEPGVQLAAVLVLADEGGRGPTSRFPAPPSQSLVHPVHALAQGFDAGPELADGLAEALHLCLLRRFASPSPAACPTLVGAGEHLTSLEHPSTGLTSPGAYCRPVPCRSYGSWAVGGHVEVFWHGLRQTAGRLSGRAGVPLELTSRPA